jgi:hypothetical protein
MTSIWQRLGVESAVIEVLESVQPSASPRLGGHPFLSAYQLAILLDARYPEVRRELGGIPVGGAESGSATSLAQYLAQRLVAEINRVADYPVEGATLSRVRLGEMWFKVPGHHDIRDSNAEAGMDLSLFRLRG